VHSKSCYIVALVENNLKQGMAFKNTFRDIARIVVVGGCRINDEI